MFCPLTPTTLGDGVSRSKFNFLQNTVKVRIKLKENTNAAAGKQICFPLTPPPPPDLGDGISCHCACQIKGNHEVQQHGSKYFALRPPPPSTTLGDGVKRSQFNFSELSQMHVSKGAKIRNRYNQVPHLTQDTNGKVTNSQ